MACALAACACMSPRAAAEPPRVNPNRLSPGPVRQEALPPELEERIRRFEATFGDANPMSHAQWVEGFLRDAHPESEIAVWEAIAAAYGQYVARHMMLNRETKNEVIALLLVRSTTSEANTLTAARLKYLTPAQAREVLGFYTAAPAPIVVAPR